MNKKLLIVLFATIFYNGVIYASPVSEHVTEVRLPEEKPPTALPATVDHITQKSEPATALVSEHSSFATQKPSLPLNSETPIPAATNATPMPVVVSSAASPVTQISESKNSKHSQNASLVNPAAVTEGKNTLSSVSVDVSKSPIPPSEAPPVTKASVAPSTPAPRTSTAAATTTTTTTTTAAPKTTVKATSIAPISSSSEKVMAHNVPTPVEEKHFDGPSFIGGIVLTLGVTAIGFIAFKYYKAGKLNMNYRTL